MKKTFNLDEKLIQKAKAACGAVTDAETIRRGLQALVREEAYRGMRALLGSERNAIDVPRRREKTTSKRKRA
jgi:hypothetical protein